MCCRYCMRKMGSCFTNENNLKEAASFDAASYLLTELLNFLSWKMDCRTGYFEYLHS